MILTTHSMEEADVLCTTIGIMSNGLYGQHHTLYNQNMNRI